LRRRLVHFPARCHCLASRCIAATEVTICMLEKCGSCVGQSIQLSPYNKFLAPKRCSMTLWASGLCISQTQAKRRMERENGWKNFRGDYKVVSRIISVSEIKKYHRELNFSVDGFQCEGDGKHSSP
jgi:hypothetical protein